MDSAAQPSDAPLNSMPQDTETLDPQACPSVEAAHQVGVTSVQHDNDGDRAMLSRCVST